MPLLDVCHHCHHPVSMHRSFSTPEGRHCVGCNGCAAHLPWVDTLHVSDYVHEDEEALPYAGHE